MSIKGFFLITFLQGLLLCLLKVWFFNSFFDREIFFAYAYFFITAFVSLVLIRRLGILNYLEAIFLSGLWFLGDLLGDLLITGRFTAEEIFKAWQLWVGYAVMMFVVFAFHKKRHIQVRKELHAKHTHH